MKNPIFIAIAFLLIVVGGAALIKSSVLKSQGDNFVKQSKFEEALLYYKEAKKTFPFRLDVQQDINATQLLLNSELEYSQIVDESYAEIQAIPSTIPAFEVKAGQLFVPILMYHHIRINPRPGDPVWAALNITPEQLDSQLNYLATHNFHTVTLDDLNNALNTSGHLPDNPVILTFDDGYENFYTNAYPLLKKYNMQATEFIITQGVQNNAAYLTWNQVVEMDKSGLVTFGAHTQHHPNLPDLTQTSIDQEITLSKSDIEAHLGRPTKWFAYPYGSYNNYILSEVAKAGFTGAVSTIYSPVQSKDKLFLLPRMMIDGRFTLDEFARRLQR